MIKRMTFKNLPRHVAVIPDGNRRWATARRRPPWQGHAAGARTFERVAREAFALGIPYFTFWALSEDNFLTREKREVSFLMKIIAHNAKKLAMSSWVREQGVRVRILGRWRDLLREKEVRALEKVEDATRSGTERTLTILIAYSGTTEMVQAIRNIAELARMSPDLEINGALVKKAIYTANLPPVDLVIRTGGEPHWSAGFMMWDTAASQFYFAKTLWPDFDAKEFHKALRDYSRRERRFGT
ncbi:MAG: polyprenyl diphosphate synthase [bacterium]|nr:polyprenyl diphosphate synthase [bacterium]